MKTQREAEVELQVLRSALSGCTVHGQTGDL
jgi:hypothetical protein